MGKNNKKKKVQLNVVDFLGSGVTYIYLLVMFGIFPIFYPGTLIGIHSMKYYFFIIAASIYVCLMLFFFIGGGISDLKKKKKPEIDKSSIFIFIFLAAVIISTLISNNMAEAFYGNDRIKTGAVVLLLCVLSYYGVKKYGRYNDTLIKVNLLASGFIYLSGIFLTCKTDILNMQKDIMEEQKGIFVSPIGNINYNVSYISLMLPAAMVMFLVYKEVFMKRVLAVYLWLGFVDMICLRTDSAIVMLAFAFVLLLYFALEKTDWFLQFLSVVQLFFAANISVYLLKMVLKDHMYDFDGLNALFVKTPVVILEAVLFVFLFLLQKKVRNCRDEQIVKVQKIYKISMLALAAAVVLFVLALNLFFRSYAAGSVLENLVLNDNTGNLRGYIWIRTVELFSKLPFVNKLFGCGLGCFYDFVYPAYGADMIAKFNSVFYDPHNDFLHVLATTGIVGVIGFFGGIFSTIAASAKKRKNRKMQMVVIITLASFLVQGLVNSFTIFIIPLVFLIMAMAYSLPAEEE